jgi:hypothetical protein
LDVIRSRILKQGFELGYHAIAMEQVVSALLRSLRHNFTSDRLHEVSKDFLESLAQILFFSAIQAAEEL